MTELTKKQAESARKIVDVLLERSKQMGEKERIRYVYNNAIDDAADFAKDMASTNPMRAITLEAISREIRKWMTIPSSQEKAL